MWKLAVSIIVVVLAVSAYGYFRFVGPSAGDNSPDSGVTKQLSESLSKISADSEQQVELTPIPAAPTPTPEDLSKKVESLEKTISNLQSRVGSLEAAKPTTTTTSSTSPSSQKSPVFIPLGSTGSNTGKDWTTIDGLAVAIDPSEYNGYSTMKLQLGLKVKDANGTAYARLYNSDDGTAILVSEVETSKAVFTSLSSAGFTLPSGKKTYKIQLKSLTGYEASAQDVYVKVSF